jgi:hypothetical protein
MASAQKKVIVRTFTGELAWGYLAGGGFVRDGAVEMMEVDGRLSTHFLNEIKTIAYVRDFNREDAVDPERMGRKTFLGRPRMGGLWLRLTFRDDDVLEGMTELDLAALEGVAEDGGVMVTSPDGRGNTFRVFVPRTALRAVEVLGFVQAGVKKPVVAKKPVGASSGDLFA